MSKRSTRIKKNQHKSTVQRVIKAAGIPSTFSTEFTESVPLEIQAMGDGESGSLPTFKMRAYNGGKMNLSGFYYPVVVDLAGMRVAKKSRPILRDHDPSLIVGHTQSIVIGAKTIDVEGVISAGNDVSREVTNAAKNGFPWQASIGASGNQIAYVDRGESVEVNGKKFSGPLYVARKSTLGEISFVAMGADDSTSAKVAAQFLKGAEMEFETWLKAKGFVAAELSENQVSTMRAMFEAESIDGADTKAIPTVSAATKPQTDPVANYAEDAIHASRDSMAKETERVSLIRNLCASFPGLKIKDGDTEVILEAHAIRKGWDSTRVELEVLRASRPQAPAVHASDNSVDASVVEAALLCGTGMDAEEVGKHFDEKTMNAALSRKNQGYTLHQVMGDSIRASGGTFNGSYKSDNFIRSTRRADRKLRASGFTTLTVSSILENVANKTLLSAYQSAETTWSQICRVGNLTDFKVHSRYRLDASGSFKQVGADGELKHVGLTDAKYQSQIDTYGAIIALTRQDQINDDLDAFLQIPAMLGHMSATRVEEAVYSLLLSNPSSFFHADNKNLFTGAGSALSADSLTTGKQKFRDMVDSNGKPILTSASRLVVPSTLEDTANVLLTERDLIAGTSTTKQPKRNPHVGTMQQVNSTYLNNTSINDENGKSLIGQSDTGWYMFANPAVRAAMVVAFLNGRRVPTIESDESSFDTLGMQWRGYLDFGVSMEDPTAAVKSAGA